MVHGEREDDAFTQMADADAKGAANLSVFPGNSHPHPLPLCIWLPLCLHPMTIRQERFHVFKYPVSHLFVDKINMLQ